MQLLVRYRHLSLRLVCNHSSQKGCRQAEMTLNVFLLTAMVNLFLLVSSAIASDVLIHGFVQGNYSLGSKANPDGGDFKCAEERWQLKLDASKESFRLFIKTDAFHDHIDKNANIELREGYIDYTGKEWDLRVGKQVITWGTGDLIFITDIFPKDYEAFFSGRPMEYLKKGIDGIKIGLYPDFVSSELIIIPIFESNNYPDAKRFYMFDSLPNITNREERKPGNNLENTEIAFRIYRDIY